MKAWMVAIACWGSVAQGADTPSRLQREHRDAAALLTSEKWEAAADAYRKIVADGPEDVLVRNAQLGVARALTGAGTFEEALQGYLKLKALMAIGKSPSTWRGEQPEGGWSYVLHRGLGEVRERQGLLRPATTSYLNAVKALGQDASVADWRARAWLDAARCLVAIDQRKAAISMLSEILPELAPAEFAGMRALVKATLAQIYMDDSERDWAVTLLEEIRSDPQLDAQQFAAAEARAEGRAWKEVVTGRMRTRKGPGYLAIESGGRFELRVALQPNGRSLFGDNRYGWIMGWYNLEADPFKTTNLSALSSVPLIMPRDLSWMEKRKGQWRQIAGPGLEEYSRTLDLKLGMQKGPGPGQNGKVSFEILEENAVRVRTRTRHNRWPFETLDYTFYPTGQIVLAARFDLENDEPPLRIGAISFVTGKNPRLNWRDAVAGASRMSGEGSRSFETPFVLAHSNATPSFQRSRVDDILTFPSRPHQSRSFINNEYPQVGRLAPLRFSCDEESESQVFVLQLRVYPREIDSFALAKPYVDDVQSPAKLVVAAGAVVTDDRGDLQGDGFNESEGCYVVRGTNVVTLVAGSLARHQPAIKFLDCGVEGIPGVLVNGKLAAREHYTLAWIAPKNLLLQWRKVIESGETVRFALK